MTNKTQPITIIVNLGENAYADEVNQVTTQLYNQLLQSEVEQVEKVRQQSTKKGAKGDPITLGTLAIVVSPAVIAGVFMLINTWMTHKLVNTPQGTITLKLTDAGIETTVPVSMSETDRQAELNRLASQLQQIRSQTEGT